MKKVFPQKHLSPISFWLPVFVYGFFGLILSTGSTFIPEENLAGGFSLVTILSVFAYVCFQAAELPKISSKAEKWGYVKKFLLIFGYILAFFLLNLFWGSLDTLSAFGYACTMIGFMSVFWDQVLDIKHNSDKTSDKQNNSATSYYRSNRNF